MPLSLVSIGAFYCASPIDLIPDSTPYVGYLDEVGFILLGLVSARVAIGSRSVRSAQRTVAGVRAGQVAGAPVERPAGRINLGQIILNPRPVSQAQSARTIIISGVARSGTSMVAQVVRHAGIDLGDTADPIVHEDVEMAEALACMRRGRLRGLIERRNRQHEVWGFKLPNLHERLAPWDMALFRNPLLILVMRDPVAVAQRNVISMYGCPRAQISSALRDLQTIGQFAQRVSVPVLLLSYEKAIARPDVAVPLILEFCGLDATATNRMAATNLIQPENDAYLRSASLGGPPPPRVRLRHRISRGLLR